MQDPVKLALSIGFSHAGIIDPSKLRALPEVRDMCADGRCRRYKRSWSCPPACGTLEEAEARMHRYRCGVLVQTTAELEDDFDVDAMMEAGLADEVRARLERGVRVRHDARGREGLPHRRADGRHDGRNGRI